MAPDYAKYYVYAPYGTNLNKGGYPRGWVLPDRGLFFVGVGLQYSVGLVQLWVSCLSKSEVAAQPFGQGLGTSSPEARGILLIQLGSNIVPLISHKRYLFQRGLEASFHTKLYSPCSRG